VKFWDSSALLPLLVPEPTSAMCTEWLRDDRDVLVWALTRVEIASALARIERNSGHRLQVIDSARERLQSLRVAWSEVCDVEQVAGRAERLLRVHALRAADAMQLAAALVATGERPQVLEFVCLDNRLAEAARREGFRVRADTP
jgi:predicted nucleic acid-binding protein